MKIINPTKEKISVQIKGIKYTIEAEGVLNNIPEEHAREWQENLHKFLVLRKDEREEVKDEAVAIPKPTVTEVSAVSVQDPEVIAEVLKAPVEVTSASSVEAPVVKEAKVKKTK